VCNHSHFHFVAFCKLLFVAAGASNLSPYTFSSLGKRIRHSFREKRRSFRQSIEAHRRSDPSAADCDGCKQVNTKY
jgi:hypothetical protein